MLLLGDLVAAREAFCVATRYEAPDELSLTGLVRTQLLLGDPQSALDTTERLVERAPRSFGAHDLRGDVLIRLGRADEAKEAWTRAAGANHLSVWLAGRIRKTSIDEAREALDAAAYPRAERMLRRALALESSDIDTVVELARVLRKSERFGAAARWLDYAEHLAPNHPGARREREKLVATL
jgi:tetratricopeptide (TPR) repeat protein